MRDIDLIRTQQEWDHAYRQLAERPGNTALRRRLIMLSNRLHSDPRLRSESARARLRQVARTER
ncbi:hypothetical protein DY218_30520 [Streptomyces triticagri]|uniref:Uncharacterized protein n=1 Tax=Streptomyces triticagri TaxID=2293568 RepID=A0A372LW23_9ACTN|nr:hypothetical protein DY218_30520 [Streptomyces triticagri]